MEKQKEIDLAKVIRVWKENKKKIGVSTAITTILAIIYCIFATPIFTAQVTINPPKLTDAGTTFSQVISGLNAIGGSAGGVLQKTDADITVAMLSTNYVSDMIIQKYDLVRKLKAGDKDLARLGLFAKAHFTPDMKSGFVKISVDDKDPKLAADIANYYVVALGQLINNVAFGRANQKYQFYQGQVANALANLNNAESALKDFAKKNGIIAGQQLQVLADLSTQLQVQIVAVQTQMQSMSYYVSPDNPDYLTLQAKLDSLKSQLDKINNQNSDSNIVLPAGLAPELANQYLNLMRDFTFKELVYGVLMKQSKAAQLDALSEVQPMAIQVIDSAQVPLHKSKPKRLLIILASLLFGFITSSLYYIIRNRQRIISNIK